MAMPMPIPVASLLHLPSAAKSSVAKLRTKMKEMKKIDVVMEKEKTKVKSNAVGGS